MYTYRKDKNAKFLHNFNMNLYNLFFLITFYINLKYFLLSGYYHKFYKLFNIDFLVQF